MATGTVHGRTGGAALKTALAYYRAWTRNDMDAALSYFAGDVVCDAPAGRIKGLAAYREFLAPFFGTYSAQTADHGRRPPVTTGHNGEAPDRVRAGQGLCFGW
ncbi:MAG TPA: nuclear transport factor 2 family protein [Micromonosporaceae bacterium]